MMTLLRFLVPSGGWCCLIVVTRVWCWYCYIIVGISSNKFRDALDLCQSIKLFTCNIFTLEEFSLKYIGNVLDLIYEFKLKFH